MLGPHQPYQPLSRPILPAVHHPDASPAHTPEAHMCVAVRRRICLQLAEAPRPLGRAVADQPVLPRLQRAQRVCKGVSRVACLFPTPCLHPSSGLHGVPSLHAYTPAADHPSADLQPLLRGLVVAAAAAAGRRRRQQQRRLLLHQSHHIQPF